MNSKLKESLIKTYQFLMFPFLFLLSSIGIILFNQGGYILPESYVYLDYHLQNMSVLKRLFWVAAFDSNIERARTFSILIDSLDAHFIAWSFKWGWVHYYSVSYFIFGFIGSFFLYKHLNKTWRLSKLSALLLVGCLLSSATFVLSPIYFHSAKIICAGLGVILSTFIIDEMKNKTSRNLGLIAILCILLGLSDEIGLFVVIFWFCSFLIFQKSSFRISSKTFKTFLFSLLFIFLYKNFICPYFINLAQGSYGAKWENHPLERFFASPVVYFENTLGIWVDQIRWTFGNLQKGMAAVWISIGLFFGYKLVTSKKSESSVFKWFYLFSVAAFTGAIFLMKVRHPDISAEDVRRIYYWVPFMFFVTLGLGIIISQLNESFLQKPWINIILFSAILGNFTSLHDHRTVIWNGHLASYRAYYHANTMPLLKSLIKNKELLNSIDVSTINDTTAKTLVTWYQRQRTKN